MKIVNTFIVSSHKLVLQALSGILGLLLVSCLSSNPNSPESLDGKGKNKAIQLVLEIPRLNKSHSLQKTTAFKIEIAVSGENLPRRVYKFDGLGGNLDLQDIPFGPRRLFEVVVQNQNGERFYEGSRIVDIGGEGIQRIQIDCKALFAWISLEFQLPPAFQSKIARGEMLIIRNGDTLHSDLVLKNGRGQFLIDEILWEGNCSLIASLSDTNSQVLYRASDSLKIVKGKANEIKLKFQSLLGQSGLNIQMEQALGTTIKAQFPSSRKKPSLYGEVIISEFYAIPSAEEGSSNGEWLELSNRSADTLTLENCRISRDGQSTATTQLKLDGILLLPNTALVLSRSTQTWSSMTYSSFSLVNTSAHLKLLCQSDSTVIDSLFYSASTRDSSAVHISEGKASFLDGLKNTMRDRPESWCTASVTEPNTPISASPGMINSSCPQ